MSFRSIYGFADPTACTQEINNRKPSTGICIPRNEEDIVPDSSCIVLKRAKNECGFMLINKDFSRM